MLPRLRSLRGRPARCVSRSAHAVRPGVLLGPDEAQREVAGEEQVLLDLLRRSRTSPGQAIARIFELDSGGQPSEDPGVNRPAPE